MAVWSVLTVKVADGDAEDVARAHTERRSIEEAAETVPGFRSGATLLSSEDPRVMYVVCVWDDEDAYGQWLDSPVRAKQVTDLAGVISAEMTSQTLRTYHEVDRPR